LKKLSLIFLLWVYSHAQGQAIRPFKLVDIGTGVSLNTFSGDAETYTRTRSYSFNVNYNPDPFLNLISELQVGKLAGGSAEETLTGREFQNSFKALNLRAQWQLGLLMAADRDPLKRFLQNVYAGAGIGVIASNIKQINRESKMLPGYVTYGVNNSTDLYLPLRVGYDWKVKNSLRETLFKIDFGYQYNVGLGDNMDGFTAGRLKDNFSQFFAGVKVCAFGRTWAHAY